jgi:hypothetical protein
MITAYVSAAVFFASTIVEGYFNNETGKKGMIA